jgi:PAS domain S-box-containing protein
MQHRTDSISPASIAEYLVDESSDALFALSPTGIIISWSRGAEAVFGYGATEALGRSLIEVTVEGAEETAKAIEDTLAWGMVHMAAVRRRKDGALIDVEVSMRRVDAGAGPTFIAVSERDVTERKKLEGRVREGTRQKEDFLSTMSHELRTPLNSIIGFSELMHKGRVGVLSDQHREYLGDIIISARHLLHLVNDVVELAKGESRNFEFRPERLDIAEVVTEVRDALHALEAQKRLLVAIEVDPALGTFVGDSARVKQILYNYLSSAIRLTPEEGKITVRVAPEGPDLVRLDVQDASPGAAPAKRLQDTGFGLALSKRMAEACGGRIEVRNVAGQGSTLSAIFPRKMVSQRDDYRDAE